MVESEKISAPVAKEIALFGRVLTNKIHRKRYFIIGLGFWWILAINVVSLIEPYQGILPACMAFIILWALIQTGVADTAQSVESTIPLNSRQRSLLVWVWEIALPVIFLAATTLAAQGMIALLKNDPAKTTGQIWRFLCFFWVIWLLNMLLNHINFAYARRLSRIAAITVRLTCVFLFFMVVPTMLYAYYRWASYVDTDVWTALLLLFLLCLLLLSYRLKDAMAQERYTLGRYKTGRSASVASAAMPIESWWAAMRPNVARALLSDMAFVMVLGLLPILSLLEKSATSEHGHDSLYIKYYIPFLAICFITSIISRNFDQPMKSLCILPVKKVRLGWFFVGILSIRALHASIWASVIGAVIILYRTGVGPDKWTIMMGIAIANLSVALIFSSLNMCFGAPNIFSIGTFFMCAIIMPYTFWFSQKGTPFLFLALSFAMLIFCVIISHWLIRRFGARCYHQKKHPHIGSK